MQWKFFPCFYHLAWHCLKSSEQSTACTKQCVEAFRGCDVKNDLFNLSFLGFTQQIYCEETSTWKTGNVLILQAVSNLFTSWSWRTEHQNRRLNQGTPCKSSHWLHLQKFKPASSCTSSFLSNTMRQDPPGCYDFRPVSGWNASRLAVPETRTPSWLSDDRTGHGCSERGTVGKLWPAGQAGSAGTLACFKTKRRVCRQTNKTGLLAQRTTCGKGERRRGAEWGQQLAWRMGCDPWVHLKDYNGFCYVRHASGFNGELWSMVGNCWWLFILSGYL